MLTKVEQLEVEIESLQSKVAELYRMVRILAWEKNRAQGKPPLWLVGKESGAAHSPHT